MLDVAVVDRIEAAVHHRDLAAQARELVRADDHLGEDT